MGWLTTALILLPLGGALLVWLFPWDAFTTGSIALLVALAEVGVWIESLVRFNFSQGGLQLDQQTSWFSDLNVSYHVGMYGFSLWLVGLTVIVQAAAIVYAFWEAMLLPLYVLIGVWGGPGRLGATIKFVIYTMAGSLLMLASIIVLGLSQGTFDLTATWQSSSDWLFLGFVAAFAVKAPLFPLHGWLPDAYRESSPEVAAVLSGVISKAAIFGFIRICFGKFPGPFDDFRNVILALAVIGLVYGSLMAFRAPDVRGVIAYSSLAQMGLITIGVFAGNAAGFSGAILQSVNHGLITATLFLLAGAIERRLAT